MEQKHDRVMGEVLVGLGQGYEVGDIREVVAYGIFEVVHLRPPDL
jgi:hypothetical protein